MGIDFHAMRSPQRRRDLRCQLLGGSLLAASLAAVHTLPVALYALAILFAGVIATISWRWLLPRVALMLWAVLPLALLAPLTGGNAGLSAGALIAAKGTVLGMVLLLGLARAGWDDYLAAAHRLGMPAPLVHILSLSHRFAWLLRDELLRVRRSLRTRGFRARVDGPTYRTVANVAGTLIVRGGDRADRVGASLRVRGFTGVLRHLHEPRIDWSDVLQLMLCAGFALGMIVLDRNRSTGL